MYTTKNIDIRSKSLYVVHVKFIDIQVIIFFLIQVIKISIRTESTDYILAPTV